MSCVQATADRPLVDLHRDSAVSFVGLDLNVGHCRLVPTSKGIVRYAVVGLGHIAQVAVLPAFAHVRRNSRLTAIVSGDRTKRREIVDAMG